MSSSFKKTALESIRLDAGQGDSPAYHAKHKPDFEALEPRLLLDAAAAVTLDASQVDVTTTDQASQPATEDTSFKLNGVSVTDESSDTGQGDSYILELTLNNDAQVAGTTFSLSGGPQQASLTLTGTAASINAQISGIDVLPGENYTGELSIQLTLKEGAAIRDTAVFLAPITPVNDDPTLTGGDSSVQEAGTFIFSVEALGLADVDVDSGEQGLDQLIIQIEVLPTDGKLTFNNAPVAVGSTFDAAQLDKLKYVHSGNDVAVGVSDSFSITVFDGAGGEASGALTITLEPRNEAPSIAGDPVQFEGQSTSLGLSYSDSESGHADAPANALIEITDLSGLADRGTLFLDENQDGIADASEIISDPSDSLAAFNADRLALLSFAHDGDEPLVLKPSFTIRVTDNGGGEGDTAKLSATRSIDIAILENNDDPVVVTMNSPTDLANGDAGVMIAQANLLAEDPDSSATQLVYSIVSRPDYGQVQLNLGDDASPNWVSLPATAVFTQADINAGKVRYVQTSFSAGVTEDTGLTFKLADSEFRAFETAGQAGIWRDGGGNDQVGTLSFQINDNDSNLGTGVGALDPNVTVDTIINEGQVDFDEGSAMVTITATDLTYVLTAGGTYTLPPEQVVYSVSRLPAHGALLLDGKALELYGSFTQADINADRVSFTHDGSENHRDGFDFIVTNGGNFRADSSFIINTLPINDAPVASSTTVSVTEATETSNGTVRLGISDLAMSDADGSQDIAGDAPVEEDPNAEAGTDPLWFKITALPEDGVLERWNGSSWVAVTLDNAWYSQELLVAPVDGGTSGLRYIHGGDDAPVSLTDTLSFVVRDDLTAPADALQPDTSSPAPAADNLSGTGTVTLEVVPFNDAPIVPLTPGSGDVTITNANGDTLTTANDILSLGEGDTAVITASLLTAVDSDNTTRQATFKVGEAVSNGKLLLGGKVLNAGSTFTQADIDAGLLSYEHDGSETRTDSFRFVVSDGPLTTAQAQFDIEIAARNDVAEMVAIQPADNLIGETGLVLGTAFTVEDVDIFDPDSGLGISAGETDTIKLILVLQDLNGDQVPGGIDKASLNVDLTGLASVEVTSGIPGTDTRLVLTGNLADIQTALTTLTALTKTDLNQGLKLVATVDDRINSDTEANGGPQNEGGEVFSAANNTATVDISLIASTTNDAPTGTIADQTVTEDQPRKLTGLSVNDVDSFDRPVSVTVAVGSGVLDVAATAGVGVSANGLAAVTLTGTVSDVNAALGDITFTSAANANGTVTLDLSVTDSNLHGPDTELTTALTQAIITIAAVNDVPTLTVPGTQVLASGDNLSIRGIIVADANDSAAAEFVDSQTVNVVVLNEAGDAAGTIETTNNTATTSITISGTLAQINTELDSLVFRPGNANNDAVARIEVTFDDQANGDETTNPANAETVTEIVQVNISGLNDGPAVVGDTTATVAEDTALALDFLTIADPDDFGGTGMSITLTVTHGTFASALGVFGNGNRTLTLENATEAQLNALLAGASYTADAHYYGGDTLSLSVNDGGNTGDGPVGGITVNQDIAITVTSVNDRPLTVDARANLAGVAEGTTAPTGQALGDLLGRLYDDSTDNQDANNGGTPPDQSTPLSYIAIVGNPATADQGHWQVEINGSWVTVPAGVTDSRALIVATDAAVRFLPATDFNGTPDSLNVRLGDNSQPALTVSTGARDLRDLNTEGDLASGNGVWSSNTVAIDTAITAVNDAPTTPRGTVTLAAIAEDTVNPTGATVAALLGANFDDATDDQTQEATSGGSSANSFGGIALTGNPHNAAEGTWQFNTGGRWTDVPAGVDADNALILGVRAQLRFVPATDFYGIPTGLQYVAADSDQSGVSGTRGDVTFNATGTWSDSASAATIETEILARNDAPVLTVDLPTEAAPVTATENAGAGTGSNSVGLATNALLTDVDTVLGTDDFGGGSLTITLADATAADVVSVNNGLAGFDSQSASAGALTVNFSAGASAAQIAALVNSLSYTNTSDAPDESRRAFTLVINDGNNNGQAGGPTGFDSNTVTGYLQVQNTNDLPVISVEAGDSIATSVTETNAGLTGTGTLSVEDLDTTDTVSATVNAVASTGDTDGLTSAELSAMLTVNAGNIIDGVSADGTLTWDFNSNGEAFDHLAAGEALVLTYTIQVADSAGAITSQDITVTINGTSDAPAISIDTGDSATTSIDETDAGLSTGGTLSVQDLDTSNTVTPSVLSVAASGATSGAPLNSELAAMLSVDTGDIIDNLSTDGTLNWSFDSDGEAFDYLAAGESLVLTYIVQVTDSDNVTDSQTITVTINGTNDAATVSSGSQTLTETNAALSTGGKLTSTDVDNTDNAFTANAITGTIGEFRIDAGGAWTFAASSAFDNLNVGDSVTETFSVTSVDGTVSTVQITINGTNDAATVSGDSKALSETDLAVTTSGTLTSSDPDNVDNTFFAASTTGSIGDFSIDANGDWSFTANSAFDNLNVNESETETFAVASIDGTASNVQVTINGTNDRPVITAETGDSNTSSVTETNAGLTDTGTLSLTDADTTDTVSAVVDGLAVTGATNGLTNGQLAAMFTVDAGTLIDGVSTTGTLNWGFDSAGEAFDYLAAGESLALTYTIKATDANGGITNQEVTVTINGSNDAPVISLEAGNSASETLIETNGTLTSAGSLSVSDLDTTNIVTASIEAVTTSGDVGALELTELLDMLAVESGAIITSTDNTGVLNWTFDSAGEAFNHLAEGESLTLSYVVRVTDSSGDTVDQTVTITVSGTQDAPIIITENLPPQLELSDSETIEPFNAGAAFVDSDNDSLLTFAADNLPAGLSIDSRTGLITGTVSGAASQDSNIGNPGSYLVTLTATDADGNVGETTITLQVANPAPDTVDVTATLEEDRIQSANGNLLLDAAGNNLQTDPDGDALVIASVNDIDLGPGDTTIQGEFGQLIIAPDGEWRYVLNNNSPDVQRLDQGQTATDTFSFLVDDGQGGQSPATLALNITGSAEAVIRPQADQPASSAPDPLVPDAFGDGNGGGEGVNGLLTGNDASGPNVLASVSSSLANEFPSIEPVQLTIALRDIVARQSIYEFSLPANAFESSNNEELTITATKVDGSPLPEYITFDEDSGTFKVNRVQALSLGVDQIDVKVTGRDESGNEASASFVVYLLPEEEDEQDEPLTPTAEQSTGGDTQLPDAATTAQPLSDMLTVAGRNGFDAQHAEILADLMALLADQDRAI